MLLYASGAAMPGFDHVVFAPQAAAKLLQWAIFAMQILVCVSTEWSQDVPADDIKIVARSLLRTIVTHLGLYPFDTLFRKSGEKKNKREVIAALRSGGQRLAVQLSVRLSQSK